MKSTMLRTVLAVVLTTATHQALYALPASTLATVSAGSLKLTLDGSFTAALKDQGIKVTYLASEQPANKKPMFQVEGGLIDLKNGTSEVQTMGGLEFTEGKNIVSLQRLALESTGTSAAHITALVVLNGVSAGRKAVLSITGGSAFSFPLKVGQISSGDLTFKVNPAFVSEISDYFQVTPNTYKGLIGEMSLNLIIAPQE
jgi:hypothetical protein